MLLICTAHQHILENGWDEEKFCSKITVIHENQTFDSPRLRTLPVSWGDSYSSHLTSAPLWPHNPAHRAQPFTLPSMDSVQSKNSEETTLYIWKLILNRSGLYVSADAYF